MHRTTVTISGRVETLKLDQRLPRVCLVCGAPARDKPVCRTFHYWPPAVLLASPLVILPFALVIAVFGITWMASAIVSVWAITLMGLGQRVKLAAPVCSKHRWHWAGRSIAIGLAFAPSVAAGIASGAYLGRAVAGTAGLPDYAEHGLDQMAVVFAGVAVGLAAGTQAYIGAYLMLRRGTARLRRIDGQGVTLLGVSPAFAVAVAEVEEASSDDDEIESINPPARKPYPHCGEQLPAYAEACRFCKRLLQG